MTSPARKNPKNGRLKRFLSGLGPGLVTGASDDDPSGIGTYAIAGASFGYATLWLAWVTFPLMAAVQYICAKIGMVSGQGLAGVLRGHYSGRVAYAAVSALLIANTINAGADMLAIAAGINLLVPVPVKALVLPIGLLILLFQVYGSYRQIAGIFKWLTVTLLAYVGAGFLAHPDWAAVARATLQPAFQLNGEFLALVVAILGTTISPYLFFWQSSQMVEEEISKGRTRIAQRRGASEAELKDAAWDVNLGMFGANGVMFFIVLATAATLHQNGITEITSAADAAEALRPLAGDAATVLMALGLIGTGFLAVPILTGSAAYALCEVVGWKCSLDAAPSRAKEFYLAMGAATVGGMLIDYSGVNPMQALFWTAVINGFLAPPLLLLIMLVANNKDVMGKRVNGAALNVLGWAATAIMFAAAVALVFTWNS